MHQRRGNLFGPRRRLAQDLPGAPLLRPAWPVSSMLTHSAHLVGAKEPGAPQQRLRSSERSRFAC